MNKRPYAFEMNVKNLRKNTDDNNLVFEYAYFV